MATKEEKIRYLLTASTSGYSANMKKAAEDSARLDKEIMKTSKSMIDLGKSSIAAGAALTAGLTVPLVAGVAASIKFGADFQKAMVASTAIMSDLTGAMEKDMADAAREIAKVTRFSAAEAAEAYFFLASAGLDAAQSIAALPEVAQFAQAGNFDLALATDLLTDAQSALGLTIRDDVTKNMENMVKVSDVLVKANTLANASVQQFSESLTNRAGAALKSTNKSIEEGVAVLAAFADQGLKGQVAGQGLFIVLRDLQTAALKNEGTFKKHGITVFDNAGKLSNMADIVGDLEDALEGATDKQKKATLAALGFADRSQGMLLTLLGTSDAIREYEEKLKSAGGTTQEVSDKQIQNFWDQLGLLQDKLKDVGIELSEVLLPILSDFIENLDPVIEGVKEAAEWFGELDKTSQKALLGVAGLAAGTGPLLIALGTLSIAIGGIKKALIGMSVATITATGGIAAITGGIALLVIEMKKNMNQALKDIEAGFKDTDAAGKRFGEGLDKTVVSIEQINKWQAELNRLTKEYGGDVEKATAALREQDAAFAAFSDNLKSLSSEFKRTGESNEVVEELIDNTFKLGKTAKEAAAEQKKGMDIVLASLKLQLFKKEAIADFDAEYFLLYRTLLKQQGKDIETINILIAKKAIQVAQSRVKATEKGTEEEQEIIATFQSWQEVAAQGVADSIKSIWSDQRRDFEDVWKGALNSFVDTLAQMVVQNAVAMTSIQVAQAAATAGMSLFVGLLSSAILSGRDIDPQCLKGYFKLLK